MKKENKLSITIDNRKVQVKTGLTILQAAREHDIYIPSLCTLEPLPSYGACRLCIVEVDGLRGYPTSCTTPVEDGMTIRTDTAELRALRQEVLKLLLSEHPASCLFCTEHDECKQYQGTIRKVGVTTGCRYCPNDDRCELQTITEKVGLTETSYPVYYRGFPVEKDDPFYDRDYNLCILCGRCVRACNDVRLNGTLSFKQRGKLTTIGAAFDRTHLEAGCEFCGACVSVCPTGALSAKVSKWYGKPDAEIKSTCLYCSVGCELMLQVKNNETIDALPNYNSAVDQGLICVKGRFAVPEYVAHHERISVPQRMTPLGYEDISWGEAIGMAAEKLSGVKADDVLVVVSSQLTNEDLYVVGRFAKEVIKTDAIMPEFVAEMGEDLGIFLNLVCALNPLDVIDTADMILTVGFDSTYGFTPVGIRTKRAAKKGAHLFTLNTGESNLDMLSEEALQAEAGKWPAILDKIIEKTKTDAKSATPPKRVVVIGEGALFSPKRSAVLEKIVEMRDRFGWSVIVAHPYSNLLGLLAVGAFPGIKGGDILRDGSKNASIALGNPFSSMDLSKRKKVVYLIGEEPLGDLPECDFLIYQNTLPSASARKPDLLLPASPFPEISGTVINSEGKILSVNRATKPYRESKPDWWIINEIVARMKKSALQYGSLSVIQKDMRKLIAGPLNPKKQVEFKKISAKTIEKGIKGRHRITRKPWKDAYRGIALKDVVPGMMAIEQRRCHE